GALSRSAEFRDQFRLLPRCRRPLHAADHGELLGGLRRGRHPPVVQAVRRGGSAARHLGAAGAAGAGRHRDRQPRRVRPLRPAAVHRQLLVHAIGVAGHDVVKYALDTYASDNGASLSCTHDANAWPSDRYAGLPAPREDEVVTLWLQNSHAVPIPAGAITLDRMGAGQPVFLDRELGPFATVALDAG